MNKHTKQAFGIFEDGPVVTFVNLVRDEDIVYIQALDRNELVVPLYRRSADEGVVSLEPDTWDKEHYTSEDEVKFDDFSAESEVEFQLQPFDRILAGYDLKHGVIALNVNEENLKIIPDSPTSSSGIRKTIKQTLEKEAYKNKDWQHSEVNVGGVRQLWIHSGINQLLELVIDFQRNNKVTPFYQLADANDIALTDFFKLSIKDKTKKELLVYVGHEYRKAFLFENGEWHMTLPLQIAQKYPDPEILYSKLSLALDSAQVSDPDCIFLCGANINADAVDYLKTQFPDAVIDFMRFPQLVIERGEAETFDYKYLGQFALSIALAYKALYPEDPRFTPSNFLPARIIEGQKVFKIAWHGFLTMGAIFLVSVYATWTLLGANLTMRKTKQKNSDLSLEIATKRLEAGEIKKIRDDIAQQEKTIEAMRALLEGKNPWTNLLNLLMDELGRKPITWLSNLRKEAGKLQLTGTTTNRNHIVEIASLFEEPEIKKISHARIRNNSLWNFEMQVKMPVVDWVQIMEADMQALVALKERMAQFEVVKPRVPSTQPVQSMATITQASAQETPATKAPSQLSFQIPEIHLLSILEEDMTSIPHPVAKEYWDFIAAVKKGSTWHYRDLGTKFIQNNPSSELVPYVQWRMAYRYYLDKEYVYARQNIDPLMRNHNKFYPFALLLAARIEYFSGGKKYQDYYGILKTDYADHSLAAVFTEDLAALGGGAK